MANATFTVQQMDSNFLYVKTQAGTVAIPLDLSKKSGIAKIDQDLFSNSAKSLL